MNALFEVEFTFELTGRGVFLFGQILEGDLKIGHYLHFQDEWREEIIGIEMADGKDKLGKSKFWVVIQLEKLAKKKISEIQHLLLKKNQFMVSKDKN